MCRERVLRLCAAVSALCALLLVTVLLVGLVAVPEFSPWLTASMAVSAAFISLGALLAGGDRS
ncbi:MAG: hypothetical protein GEV07_30830 [Streptosporangiales bacterium]|nr:hypothetical protein [Streptosporangiales bacterium]